MDQPLVSICVPTYNGTRYVGEAIRSVLDQTVDPAKIELVVSDSGSTDGTLDCVRDATAGSPFPVRILDERTPGMVANWNASIRAARGLYVKFLFQDDLLAPSCVEKMLTIALANPDIAIVFCRRNLLIDPAAEGLPTAILLRQYEHLHRGFRHLRLIQRGTALLGDRALLMPPINKIGEPTVVLLQREKMIDAGLFNLRMRQLVDVEMWLRMLVMGDVAFVDDPLASFRVHAEQTTAKNFVTDADDLDYQELYRRLSQPDLYRRLHVAARHLIRKHSEEQLGKVISVSVLDRAYALARRFVHFGRKLSAAQSMHG